MISHDCRADRKSNNKRYPDVLQQQQPPPPKRRLTDGSKSIFSRLSGPTYKPEEENKPRIFSRVIKEQPSREDIVAAQGSNDEESKARNRRIFGSLLGTLQKFCQEETKLKSKADKKAEIEKKLDEKQRHEKEKLRKEKQNLIKERRKQQLGIRLLEIKMTKLKELESWEVKQRLLGNFIRTKATPHLYYLPKHMTGKLIQSVEKSKEEVEKTISKRKKQVHKDISMLEEQFANEIQAVEKDADAINESELLSDAYAQASDADVSLIEPSIEPIAFESDSENNTTTTTHYLSVEQKQKKPTPIVIKKEKFDDENSSVYT